MSENKLNLSSMTLSGARRRYVYELLVLIFAALTLFFAVFGYQIFNLERNEVRPEVFVVEENYNLITWEGEKLDAYTDEVLAVKLFISADVELSEVQTVVRYDPQLFEFQKVQFTEEFGSHEAAVDRESGAVLVRSKLKGFRPGMDRNWVILILKTLKSADSTLSLICDEGLSFMVEQGGENVLSCDVLERQKLFIETRQRLKSDIPGACGDPIPLPPQNISATSIVSAEKESSVVLRWSLPLEVTSTALSYGVKSGEYIYGIPTLPTGNEFKINNLEPGREYYFVMQSTQGCSQSAFSDEVKVFVPGLVEKESTPAAVLKVNSIEDEKLINLPSPNVWRLLELDLLARIDIWSMYGVIFLLTSVFLLLSHSVTSRFRGNKNAKDDLSFWV